MNLIKGYRWGLVPVLFMALYLTSCDSKSSRYAELRNTLNSYQQAATQTVDSMVAVQESLVVLASSAELTDEELDMAAAQFNGAVDDFADAAQKIVVAETDLQNAIDDLSTSGNGSGWVQQALGARDVTNVLTGGVTGLADKMHTNRLAINEAYDELYRAYDAADLDAIEVAKAKIDALGKDTLFSWLKKTTTTLVTAPIGAVVEGVKKGAVLLKFGVKTAVSKVWAKGCEVIAGPAECAGGIDAPGCAVSFNRTDEAGRAEVPAGNVTVLVSGEDIARVRLDDVPIAENEEKELILPETPIDEADEDNLANGEIPEPDDEGALDTHTGTETSDNDRTYILCFISDPNDNYTTHFACRPFEGSFEELNQLSVEELNALCVEAGYEQFWGSQRDESSCIEECLYYVCDTPE